MSRLRNNSVFITTFALLLVASMAFAGAVSLTKQTADTLYTSKSTRNSDRSQLNHISSIIPNRTGINGRNDRQDTALKNATGALHARTTYYSDYNHLLNAPVLESTGDISVVTMGADPNGVLNCWSSVQLAVNARPYGGTILFPNKSDGTEAVYEWANNKQVILPFKHARTRYKIKFAEGASIHFTNMTCFAFNINPDLDWPQAPSVTVEGGNFNGVDSQQVKVFKLSRASIQRNNNIYTFCRSGLETFDYCDLVRDNYNSWFSAYPCTGWFYKMNGPGDSYISNQLFTVAYDGGGNQMDADGIWLSSCGGATINGLNGGNHKIIYSNGVDISSGHMEHKTGTAFYVKGSQVKLRDNVFIGMSTISKGIEIEDETAAQAFKSAVMLSNNQFIFSARNQNSTRASDIHITSFNLGSRLMMDNNLGYAYESTYFVKDPASILITSSDSAISEALSTYKYILGSACELKYDNSGWVFDSPNSAMMVGTPTLSVASSTNYPSSLTTANQIYYKVAMIYPNGAMSAACSLTGNIPAANGNALKLSVTLPSWPGTLRVWRDSTGGGVTWDGYADIGPITAGYTELYDMGVSLSGVPWLTTNIPTVPTSAVQAHKTVYFNATSVNAGNGTSSRPYKTVAALKAAIPYTLFGNYSVIVGGANSTALDFSGINTNGAGLYLSGVLTDVDTGTVTTAYNPTNAVDGTAKLCDGTKTFGNYSGPYVVRITSGTGSGQIYKIRYNNNSTIYPESKWSTKPDTTSHYAISKYTWRQTGAITTRNIGNFNIANCDLQVGTSTDGLTATNVGGSVNNIYSHGNKYGLNFISCPNMTIVGNTTKANTSDGVFAINSYLIANYNASALNAGHGFNISRCPTYYNQWSDSRNNTGWGYYLVGTDNGTGFYRCRSLSNIAGDLIASAGSAITNITKSIFSGAAAIGIYVTGGSTLSIGSTATTTTLSGHAVGIKTDQQSRTTGTANFSYSGNTRDKFTNISSYGWSD